MSLGPLELLVLVAVLLLVVGPAVLPRIMRNLGKGVGSFRRGLREGGRPEELRGTLEREDPTTDEAGEATDDLPRLPRREPPDEGPLEPGG
ncbi:MAG: twin-arginine translocase TatA/TatE family subunit [Deltaproteobacteria bacterium]|nr:twin-arginine translocase TatA/TatE family subunit [Deltaproteobacteria bacterium]